MGDVTLSLQPWGGEPASSRTPALPIPSGYPGMVLCRESALGGMLWDTTLQEWDALGKGYTRGAAGLGTPGRGAVGWGTPGRGTMGWGAAGLGTPGCVREGVQWDGGVRPSQALSSRSRTDPPQLPTVKRGCGTGPAPAAPALFQALPRCDELGRSQRTAPVLGTRAQDVSPPPSWVRAALQAPTRAINRAVDATQQSHQSPASHTATCPRGGLARGCTLWPSTQLRNPSLVGPSVG